MTTPLAFLRLPILLLLTVNLISFSTVFAQTDTPIVDPTETITSNKKTKDNKTEVSIVEKNTNNLRKINLLLAIAQERDRQAGEAVEDIRSRRIRVEENLAEAEDNPKDFSKKEQADLETQLKSLQKKEKLAQKARETANNFLIEVTQAVAAEPAKRSKFLSAYERKFGPINDAKPIESLSDTDNTTEKDKAKSVTMSEKNNTIENTLPLSEPIVNENTTEKIEENIISTSKKTKNTKARQNTNPKKIVEKTSRNKKITLEPTKTDETFPLVFNQNTTTLPPSVEMTEPFISEQTKNTQKREPQKTAKKKAKKDEKMTEKVENFFVTLSDNTVIVPTTTSTTKPVTDNSTVQSSQESTLINDETTDDNEEKTKKKSKKNEKKPKKNGTTDATQVALVSYKTYDRTLDVFMKSPAPECVIAYEGKDKFTGKNKRETASTRFFTHTDEMMRKALQDKDFITCDLTGTKVESSRYTYLNMTFTILSKDIQRSLGFLDRGTPIIFVLVNGRKITMRTNKTDIGVVDIDKGLTIYKAQLTAESITDLTESELDYVRVNWSSGYEDYEVYDVDILKNLFNCLYKK